MVLGWLHGCCCFVLSSKALAVDVDPFLLTATGPFAHNYAPMPERNIHLFTGFFTANEQLKWIQGSQTTMVLEHRLEQQSGVHLQWNNLAIGDRRCLWQP